MKKRTADSQKLYSRIYSLVMAIPPGKVCTYGQITRMARLGKNYRLIGYALHNLPADSNIPWQRVVNHFGRISYSPSRRGHDFLQKILLEQEGIVFDKDDKIDLHKFGYKKRGSH